MMIDHIVIQQNKLDIKTTNIHKNDTQCLCSFSGTSFGSVKSESKVFLIGITVRFTLVLSIII